MLYNNEKEVKRSYDYLKKPISNEQLRINKNKSQKTLTRLLKK